MNANRQQRRTLHDNHAGQEAWEALAQARRNVEVLSQHAVLLAELQEAVEHLDRRIDAVEGMREPLLPKGIVRRAPETGARKGKRRGRVNQWR